MKTEVYNHFERFDIEEDEGKHPNFSYGKHMEISTTGINSPLLEKVQKAEEIPDHNGCKEERQDEQRQGPVKRKPRKLVMDFEGTVIPDHIEQSWLQDTSNITRSGTKKKVSRDMFSTLMKRSLVELPLINFIAEEIPDHHGCKKARQGEQRQGPVKRKPRKQAGMVMDFEGTVIPDHIYESWQQDTSHISGRRTTNKVSRDVFSTLTKRILMEQPLINFIGREARTIPSSESRHDIYRFMQKSIQDDPTRKGLIHHPDTALNQ